jgi:type I restriction enzyme S subunit
MREGWELKKLGEVCEKITRGISPKYIEKNGTLVLNQKCVRDHKINFDLARLHDENVKSISNDKFLRVGDVLVNSTGEGTLGRVAQVRDLPEEKVTVDSHVSIVRPLDSKFYLDFFGWAMVYIESEIEESGAGASGQTELARTILENNFSIAYPKSLPEQQRIVAILDEAFAAIAKAKANAEQNLKNAKELFESYLQAVFEKKGKGWETKTVQEIAKVINGYAFSSNDFQSTNSIKSVKITNVGVKEFVEESENYLPEKFRETFKEFQVREGDIVIALTRTIISAGLKVAVIPKSYDGALINQRVAAMTPKEKLVNQEFLYFFLCSKAVEKYVLEHVNTLMQPNLSINDLKIMPVNLPSLQEQQTIVRQLDALRAETQRLEAVYQQKLVDLEELKKSILQKAFAGELNTEVEVR